MSVRAGTEPDAPLPILNPRSTPVGILCTWQNRRSNGHRITAYRLQRRRLRGQVREDASDSSDSVVSDSSDSETEAVVDTTTRTAKTTAQGKEASRKASGRKRSGAAATTGGRRTHDSAAKSESLAARDSGPKWLMVETDAPLQLALEVYRNEGCPATPQNDAMMQEFVSVTHGTSGQMCARWINDLLSGSQHYVRVQVRNKLGWSQPSDVICIAGTKGRRTPGDGRWTLNP